MVVDATGYFGIAVFTANLTFFRQPVPSAACERLAPAGSSMAGIGPA
jgi:hypothetical protein